MKADMTAQRYAEALFGIGRDTGKLRVFEQNAADFERILKQSRDLRISLSHPNVAKARRGAIIDAVLRTSGYDPVFCNFVRLVVRRGRILYFPSIVASFAGLEDEAAGRMRGCVYAAQPLSEAQKSKLRDKVQHKLGCEVILTERRDESLIGGIRIEIGGRVYDGSVKHALETLEKAMRSHE